MNRNIKRSQKGFTLVELAIVLVIIGLIVSGVLVGQDLIKAAELRATTKQLQDFQVGVNTFIGKYSKIPGDIDGSKYGLGGTSDGTAGKGDENGLITESGSATAITDLDGEITDFWAHLTASGKELIQGVYDGDDGSTIGEDIPAMRFGSRGWGVYGVSGANYFITGVIASNTYSTADTFVPIDAFNIDSKIDDGVPSSGNVQVVDGQTAGTPNLQDLSGGTATFATGATGTATACVATTPAPDAYQFTATTALCNMRFKMQTF